MTNVKDGNGVMVSYKVDGDGRGSQHLQGRRNNR